mmetsp:Transcript_36402/g.74219  ORF Transcript_36402/g.74219 Transcript_36402/m.74219 type:complete len:109 (-) Transcript_36402:2146-2472(-)
MVWAAFTYETSKRKSKITRDANNFIAGREKQSSDVHTISSERAEAAKKAGDEFDSDAFLEHLREKYPDKCSAIKRVRAYKSVRSKRKNMLTSVIASVEKEAKERNVEE